MSSANSANSDPTSLEKQLTTKLSILNYFYKNIKEAIQKLNEISLVSTAVQSTFTVKV